MSETHSAVIRLTLFYLAVVAALSIGFSLAVYRISAREFERPLARPTITTRFQPDLAMSYEELLQQRADESRARLKRNLVMLNIATIIAGSAVSYVFARRTLRPVEEAFAAQGRFTADASHELRTPLTAMQTEIEVGLRNPKLKLTEAKALLGSTLEEVGKLSVLTNGLLKLAGNDTSDMPKNPVNAVQLAEQAMAQVEPARAAKQITIAHKLDKTLEVAGDEQSLRELLVILLDNSIKYSPKQTNITISGRTQGKYGYLMVHDQGFGIKASDIPHIFERFYRADTSRTKQHIEGYGLGLSLAQQIAEAHHGTIEVVSKPGEGSTFTVKLPLVHQASENSQTNLR